MSMKLISTTTLGSSATNIEFTNIPGTYTDLYLLISARGDRADIADVMGIQFNGESATTNYKMRSLIGDGTNLATYSNILQWAGHIPTANATSNTFSSSCIYIPNYAGSTNKSYSGESVTENNATAAIQDIFGGLWEKTNAITSLKLVLLFGTNYVTNTRVSLYGITKGSDGVTTAS